MTSDSYQCLSLDIRRALTGRFRHHDWAASCLSRKGKATCTVCVLQAFPHSKPYSRTEQNNCDSRTCLQEQQHTSVKCFASRAKGSGTGSGRGASAGLPSGKGGRRPMEGAWMPQIMTVAGCWSSSSVTCGASHCLRP